MKNDPWDNLTHLFAGDVSLQEIPAEAADNVLIAWPVIIRFIHQYGGNVQDKRALDYGCGGGRFAAKLETLGFKVYGVDSSPAMIDNARSHYGRNATFITGDDHAVTQYKPLGLITSLMTFEFVPNFEEILPVLLSSLDSDGLFVFATHNPAYVKDCIGTERSPYIDFDSADSPTKGTVTFGDIRVPIYLRDSDFYKHHFQSLGYNCLLEDYPPFTPEFLSKYPTAGPTQNSEFLILGFHKSD